MTVLQGRKVAGKITRIFHGAGDREGLIAWGAGIARDSSASVAGPEGRTYKPAPDPRRGAGVVDRGGLENRCTPCGYRGFESLPLRQTYARARCCNRRTALIGFARAASAPRWRPDLHRIQFWSY